MAKNSFEKKYILLNVINKKSEKCEERLKSWLKDNINGLEESASGRAASIVVIYPTHDGKCYIASLKKEILDLITEKLKLAQNGQIKFDIFNFELTTEDTDELSNYAYYDLKKQHFKDSKEPILFSQRLRNEYGMDYVRIKELDDEENENSPGRYFLKADLYQKNLLEFKLGLKKFFSNEFLPKETINRAESNSFTGKFAHLDVVVFKGNLLEQDVDVIVNASNERLILGGGISGAIDRTCGPKVQKELKDYLEKKQLNRINVSDCMHTKAYNIKAKYIIHACGPRWDEYPNKEKCSIDLESTFLKILQYAESLNVNSIGVPLISSGIFGVPREICCTTLYDAVKKFSLNNQSQLKQIRLVNIEQETSDDLVKKFKQKFSLEEQSMVEITESQQVKNENVTNNETSNGTRDPYENY